MSRIKKVQNWRLEIIWKSQYIFNYFKRFGWKSFWFWNLTFVLWVTNYEWKTSQEGKITADLAGVLAIFKAVKSICTESVFMLMEPVWTAVQFIQRVSAAIVLPHLQTVNVSCCVRVFLDAWTTVTRTGLDEDTTFFGRAIQSTIAGRYPTTVGNLPIIPGLSQATCLNGKNAANGRPYFLNWCLTLL